jgi:RHS repeat-associated protein
VQVVVSNVAQGWGLGYWGATSVVTSAQAHSGSYSLAQSGATTGGSYQDVSVTPGASYQVSVWVRADAGTAAQMYLWLHDTTGGNAENTAAITPGQSWQQVTLTYVANSTGQMRIHLHYVAGAGTIYYDDVQVVALNPPGNLNFANHYKFTGKERDPETGCDYFGARYYCNPIGRFITADWAAKPTAVPYANFGNPQSLNLYSYVKNNPTTFGDPDGHCAPVCVIAVPIVVTAVVVISLSATPGGRAWIRQWWHAGQQTFQSIREGIGSAKHSSSNNSGTSGTRAPPTGGAAPGTQAKQPVQPYETGPANDLRARSVPGDGLDIHHVPQAGQAEQLFPGYDRRTGPAMAVPDGEHGDIPTLKGPAKLTPEQQIAKDIQDLIDNTNAPPDAINKADKAAKELLPNKGAEGEK